MNSLLADCRLLRSHLVIRRWTILLTATSKAKPTVADLQENLTISNRHLLQFAKTFSSTGTATYSTSLSTAQLRALQSSDRKIQRMLNDITSRRLYSSVKGHDLKTKENLKHLLDENIQDNERSGHDDVGKVEQKKPVDIDEELLRYDYEEYEVRTEEAVEEDEEEIIQPISLERGVTGVFDISELVTVLKEENARDICVVRVPKEYRYVDYMVICTGKSTRHIRAMADYIRWAYKKKRGDEDAESVKIEGELSRDWFALDLGNIAVHLFLSATRKQYDLEQLWTVGPDFDDKSCMTDAEFASASSTTFSLNAFSFDAELQKFRRLRREEGTDNNQTAAVKQTMEQKQ